ncbi:hypothetical protein EVAR_41039_1 [Eumeta japonica]|uniref:Uncharacterized protein n=1 Tax=Eumeta variegata TaxID=151549 RepID=A0A4C1Z1J3_EUMVA|nr:hypothetical protein EVAR_41039_1 [Eumeta japonica]
MEEQIRGSGACCVLHAGVRCRQAYDNESLPNTSNPLIIRRCASARARATGLVNRVRRRGLAYSMETLSALSATPNDYKSAGYQLLLC